MHLSFWEQDSFFNDIDFAVIGSGIVGLSAAIGLKNKYPKAKVVVLERGFLPTGASTKNAGFACFGSPTEILDDLTKMSEDEVLGMVEKRWRGLKNLRSLLGDEQLGFQQYGSSELFTNKDKTVYEQVAEQLNQLNKQLKPIFKTDVFTHKDELIHQFGFKNIEHLIHNSLEGQIDTGKMMVNLLSLARAKGVLVYGGVEVKGIENNNGKVEVNLANYSIKAGKVIVATNGFAKQLLPELNVDSARAQVFVTEEIKELQLKGTFHYEQGYYYFRNVGNRVLFGGGRNLAFKEENTTDIALTELIQNKLEEILKTVILPYQLNVKIETRWAGIMGVGDKKTTIVKQLDGNIYCAVRMGGMGVAIGSLIGKEVAELL
jgi:glycine/D-amino acid oxidase-like deaminating enzyme